MNSTIEGDHRQTMIDLALSRGWKRGIELGLGSGLLFERFLASGLQMVGVDLGERPDRKARCSAILGSLGRNSTIIWGNTHEVHHQVPDRWADFCFIDAGHSYSAVMRDIEHWESKVRPGGWLGGHDFHPAFPGVIAAVKQSFGQSYELHDGWIWARIEQ